MAAARRMHYPAGRRGGGSENGGGGETFNPRLPAAPAVVKLAAGPDAASRPAFRRPPRDRPPPFPAAPMSRPAARPRPNPARSSRSSVACRSARSGRRGTPASPALLFAAAVGLAVVSGGSLADTAQAQEPPRQHPLVKAIRYAEVGAKTAEAMPHYTAKLRRREVVNGKPVESLADVKIRHEPFAVYMKFTDEEQAGRQVLYAAGANGNKMLVRDASGLKSLAGTMELAPDSALVLARSRHQITECGLANLARGVIARWELEKKYGECDVRYFADAKQADGRPAVVIEVTHPTPRREFRYAKTRLWMDKETKLPVRVQNYEFRRGGGDPVLVEDYTYSGVNTSAALSAMDFDRRGYRL